MVVEMAASSREQLTGVNQINVAVVEVDHVTQANAAQTEELSATAVSLADKARHLETLVASFELGAGTSPAARAAHASPLARARANVRPGRVAAVQEPTFRRAAGGYEEL
jgi:methyl-accepting chemotaxis protein